MGLLGKAALILSFDIDESAIAEHDKWHSHEHLLERMLIPGFLRGSRWISTSGGPRYFVLYEVDDLGTLTSEPYLDRLNNPSAWTARMMKHYKGMKRGFCRLTLSSGDGLGTFGFLVRLRPKMGMESALREWLNNESLPSLIRRRGLVGAYLFESGLAAEMTEEQRIRGKDGDVDWILLVTGYDLNAIESLSDTPLSAEALDSHGATGPISGTFQLVHALAAIESKG